MMRYIFIIFYLLNISVANAQSITAAPSTGWSLSIPSSTVSEAGMNYTTNFTSLSTQTLVDLNNLNKNSNYSVSIKKTDTVWDSGVTIWVRRTGNGIGNQVSITGGTAFFQLTSSLQTFFSGSSSGKNSDLIGISIEYEIRGVSVLVPVRTYTSIVQYSLVN